MPLTGPLSGLSSFGQKDSSAHKQTAYSYAFRGDGDIFDQAASQNLPRILKQARDPSARGPIPVIARDETTYHQLLLAREAHMGELDANFQEANGAVKGIDGLLSQVRKDKAALQKMDPRDPRVQADLSTAHAQEDQLLNIRPKSVAARDTWKAQLDASYLTPIIQPKHSPIKDLDPHNSKLYVLGHGFANGDKLSSTASGDATFSLKDVAKGLKEDGLHPAFESFRMPSCHSADTENRPSFVENPPARTYSGTAPAQTFANELKSAGFSSPKVTGYQGAGKRVPDGRTAERVTSDNSDVARRSEVAKVFTPESQLVANTLGFMSKLF
ncbi:hypothetical protein G3O00_41035 [Burkholderia sp. Ac-20384]|uniref:hypothetical protein n=1 Tax=Burkholderia sp. Ac-20384 TaxID=2703902 RepID=UPI001980958F|nr:hypothetical protein [Burkholderia sp. Ac-20384]MBN3829908.1 hypothetical protein [Burkholderia sp. Ac-20384]